MKVLLTIALLFAMMFAIYKQREKIGELSTSLTEQTDKADKLHEKLADLEKQLAKAANPANPAIQVVQKPMQSQSTLLKPAGNPKDEKSLLDPNHKTSLDPTAKDKSAKH